MRRRPLEGAIEKAKLHGKTLTEMYSKKEVRKIIADSKKIALQDLEDLTQELKLISRIEELELE